MSDALRQMKDKAAGLTAKGKWPAALDAWTLVAKAAPDDLPAQQKVGELLAKVGRHGEAVAAYESVAARYAKQGLFYKASAVCRVLLAIEPKHQRTQELIASLYATSTPHGRTAARPAPSVLAPSKAAAPAATLVAAGPPPGAKLPAPAPKDELAAFAASFEIDFDLDLEPKPAGPAGFPPIPLFSALSQEELLAVLNDAMEVRSIAAGETIVAEGAAGDSMFALAEGSASVFRGLDPATRRKVAGISPGDVFGEAAMVSGAPRLASVVADGEVVVLELRRDAMAKVIARHPPIGQAVERFYRSNLLANVLRASPILRALPPPAQAALAKLLQPATFAPGETIIVEGLPADAVHVLLRGRCAVTHASGERYPDLVEGDLFGELSVLQDGVATASVAAHGPALTLRLPAEEFKARVLADPAAKAAVERLAQARLERTARLDEAPDDRRV